jgi:hypothetical protein
MVYKVLMGKLDAKTHLEGLDVGGSRVRYRCPFAQLIKHFAVKMHGEVEV